MRLPTSAEVAELYARYHTPAPIQDHMRVVAAIASELAQYHPVDLGLVRAAALLHDLVRIPEQWQYLPATIITPQPHAEINYRLLQADFPEVAAAVRPHSLMTLLQPHPLPSLAAKLVYYADKRVNHATIVTLAERLKLGQERWQVTAANDRQSELLPKLNALETELFKPVPYGPTHLQTKA